MVMLIIQVSVPLIHSFFIVFSKIILTGIDRIIDNEICNTTIHKFCVIADVCGLYLDESISSLFIKILSCGSMI